MHIANRHAKIVDTYITQYFTSRQVFLGVYYMTKKDIFAERLKLARELRELNQGALADKAGIPASSISHFEADSRKPSFDTLRRLASALEVSTDYLLGRVEEVSASSSDGDQAFRDYKNLSSSDREAIKMMMDSLARRGEANKKNK